MAVANLRRLHQVICLEETINCYTEKNQSADQVLDIFVRANDDGTKVDKPDLLMSMITSKWSAGAPREEMFGFVEHIKRRTPWVLQFRPLGIAVGESLLAEAVNPSTRS